MPHGRYNSDHPFLSKVAALGIQSCTPCSLRKRHKPRPFTGLKTILWWTFRYAAIALTSKFMLRETKGPPMNSCPTGSGAASRNIDALAASGLPVSRTDQTCGVAGDYQAVSSWNEALPWQLFGDQGHAPSMQRQSVFRFLRSCWTSTTVKVLWQQSKYNNWAFRDRTPWAVMSYGNETVWYIWLMPQPFENTLQSEMLHKMLK